MPEGLYRSPWERGQGEILNLIDTMIEGLQLTELIAKPVEVPNQKIVEKQQNPPLVFIVHGHEEEMKQSVARQIERLGIEVIILHEKADRGRTIIEKLADHASEATFALILLSPDDIARGKEETADAGRFRARQNVILELGFFLGKLGRSHVIAIYKEDENFEIPSDYQGVLYIPYDQTWNYKVARELSAAGFSIDFNKLT